MNKREKACNSVIMNALVYKARKIMYEFDHSTMDAIQDNMTLFYTLISENANTEYGKKYHFHDIKSVEDYRNKVPMTTYEDYEPYIDRMVEQEEKNLLTNYPVVYYASTSGTAGSPKKIPVTDRALRLFRNHETPFTFGVQDEYMRCINKSSKKGKVLALLNFSSTLLPDGTGFGSISAASLDPMTTRAMKHFITTPFEAAVCTGDIHMNYINARYGLAEKDVVYLAGAYIPAMVDLMNYIKREWKMLVKDIYHGTIHPSIQMPEDVREKLTENLKPDPKRAKELAREFQKGFDETIMQRIWPKLSWIASIWAGNFSIYAEKLQQYSGKKIPYYTMSYVSSEGIFATARHPFDTSYALIPYSCFYEFIPQKDENQDDEDENPHTLLLDELEVGKSYEIVITNQSGFYRYRMGDVVKVTGFYHQTPLISFEFRKKNMVSLVGEKFTEEHLLSAIREFENKSGIQVTDYCMYPDRESDPGRYVIMLESADDIDIEKKMEYEKILADEILHASTSYAHYVHNGNMGPAKLIFLQKETFALFRDLKIYKSSLSENQLKTVRVLSTDVMFEKFSSLEEK